MYDDYLEYTAKVAAMTDEELFIMAEACIEEIKQRFDTRGMIIAGEAARHPNDLPF